MSLSNYAALLGLNVPLLMMSAARVFKATIPPMWTVTCSLLLLSNKSLFIISISAQGINECRALSNLRQPHGCVYFTEVNTSPPPFTVGLILYMWDGAESRRLYGKPNICGFNHPSLFDHFHQLYNLSPTACIDRCLITASYSNSFLYSAKCPNRMREG